MISDYIWLFWDIAAVLVIVYCIYKGVKHGFIRTVISIACYVISALAAQRFSPIAAEYIYHNQLEARLREFVARRLEEALAQGGNASSLIDALPEWMRTLASAFAGPEALSSLNFGAGARRMADIVVDEVLYEAVIWLLQGVIFLAVFTVMAWIIRRVARLFSGIYKVPVLGTINCVLGGLLGVAQGVLLLVVAGVAVQLLLTFTGPIPWMNAEVLDSTYIFRVFYGQIIPNIF